MFFNFFSRQEPKRFTYRPRYYNPDREPEDSQRKLSDQEQFANQIHNSWDRKRTYRAKKKSGLSTLIWLIVILALLLIFKLK